MSVEPKNTCDREHEFVLVLTGITELTSGVEDALFKAGCDDATISVRFGRVYLTFSRTAPSLKDAILSAVRDVKKGAIGADVLRVDDCPLVTQADIARKIGRSRQLVHQYIAGMRGPRGFPPPACHITDDAPLWYWCEVADWLFQKNMITEEAAREAQDVAVINNILELEHQRKLEPALVEEILKALVDTPQEAKRRRTKRGGLTTETRRARRGKGAI